MLRRTAFLCLAPVVLLLSSTALLAQFTTASLSGTVTDPSGAAVPEAKVSAQNTETGFLLTTVTGTEPRVSPAVKPLPATIPIRIEEKNPALTGRGIDVVAIHNHMVAEEPRVVFLHYWGIGPTEKLARGLKAALDTQHK